MVRVCKKCGEEKPITFFHKERECREGYRNDCKSCRRLYSIGWVENNRDRYNKRMRAYNKSNRLRQRLYRYDLTPEQFHTMLSEQNGLCKICVTKTNDQTLVVDHCHKTDKTRSLLCRKCNTLLSGLEKEGWLDKALNYLAFYK